MKDAEKHRDTHTRMTADAGGKNKYNPSPENVQYVIDMV